MEACKYDYIPSGAIGLAASSRRPSPELRALQQALIDAVAPYTVATGTSDAFATTPDDPVIDPLLIDYVAGFVPKSTGEQFGPHVTTGIATRPPRQDARRTVRVVHLRARRCRRLPARPVRHRGEETACLQLEALRRRRCGPALPGAAVRGCQDLKLGAPRRSAMAAPPEVQP